MESEDRQDLLRLLALIAECLGAEGLDEYEPPSVQIAADLVDPGESDDVPPGDRRAEVLAFLAQTGGG